MPKLLFARPPVDPTEDCTLRKLAGARHAPGDWIQRARIVTRSQAGLRTSQIAAELRCYPATVRTRIHRFNAHGLDGLADRPAAPIGAGDAGLGSRRTAALPGPSALINKPPDSR